MKKITALILSILATNVFAFSNSDAEKLVRNYSETIACAINEKSFITVKSSGDSKPAELGDRYITYWEGDLGCSGGNGSVNAHFTVVEYASSDTPVVLPNFKNPDIDLVCANSMKAVNDQIHIKGVTYGKNDSQHSPSQQMSYILKLDYDSFSETFKTLDTSSNLDCVSRVR